MTANEIFKVMSKNPMLMEKYGLTQQELVDLQLSTPSEHDIIEVIKAVVIGVENETPDSTINSQIRTRFNL